MLSATGDNSIEHLLQQLTALLVLRCPVQVPGNSPASSGNWFFNLALQSSLL